MKKVMLVWLCSLSLMIGGCGLFESQNLTPEQITAITNYTDNLNTELISYQKMANELTAILAAGGVLDTNSLSQLAKVNEEIDRITPQITALSAAVRDGQYSGDDVDIITILKAVKAGNQASATFNPYAVAIDGILGLLLVILGLFAKKKAAEASLATGTLKNVVTSVEASSATAYDEVTGIVRTLNTTEQKALITSLKPEIPEGYEINKATTS